jgi:hypothetical protein
MNVLWFAFGIYIVGVSALLFLQPQMMFENNVWKEFGLHNTSRATVFPVWMFIIVWSLLSYGVASLIVTMLSQLASGAVPKLAEKQPEQVLSTVAERQQLNRQLSHLNEQVSSLLETPEPVKSSVSPKNSLPYHRRRLRRRHAKPGYYIRNDSRSEGPKYIYYGEEAPQA